MGSMEKAFDYKAAPPKSSPEGPFVLLDSPLLS